jgi:preprotein translocase subunit SecD
MANLRWKLITIVSVLVIFSAVGVYPIVAAHFGVRSPGWLMEKQLKLGLDLQGGVHLVLRVRTDDALHQESETEMLRLSDALQKLGMNATLSQPDATHFKVDGVPLDKDAAFKDAANDVSANFDRSAGVGGSYTFSMKPNVQNNLREEAVVMERETLERRVNELGVTEPSISLQGTNNDQILVQLPGVTDIDRAKKIIGSTGILEFKLVEQGPAGTKEDLMTNGQVPANMEIVPGSPSAGDSGTTVYYLLRRAAAVTGRDLRGARPSLDQNGRPAVSFTLNSQGGAQFGKVTSENIGRSLAIVLDGRVQSAPRIDGRITTDGQIFGSFTQDDVQNLSLILRSGSLPASLDYMQERTIGASLGADSIKSGIVASVVGLLLIISFMLVYYKLSGVNAVVALIFNLIILLGLMAYIGAVMTLPGIAGFVLTMGIGVDSNVLIFERIKEELEAQRGVRASINAGFARVFWTLFDTHISALISVAFLFQFGTGPIRGFATTLFFGLMSNLFTSIFVSKTLFEAALARRHQVATLSI